MEITPEDILTFWFDELTPKQHFVTDEKLDDDIINRFSNVHTLAANSELSHWRKTPNGRLAEIIILDQFSRNMFRGNAKSWAYDPLALKLAREAVAEGDDLKLEPDQRVFLYMPYMHSESSEIHEEALELFQALGIESNLKFEILHKEIIDTFGRYPYRNAILGRESTLEETEYLKKHKSF